MNFFKICSSALYFSETLPKSFPAPKHRLFEKYLPLKNWPSWIYEEEKNRRLLFTQKISHLQFTKKLASSINKQKIVGFHFFLISRLPFTKTSPCVR
jgi:hypothetical protein